MLNNLFNSAVENLDLVSLIIVIVSSIICGLIISLTHKYTDRYTKGYLETITLLPLIVSIIIILVNGNLGTGIAIAGAFSLVRFRSMPGNAKEILLVFFSMAVGITLGSGYVFLAFLLTIVGSLILLILEKTSLFNVNKKEKVLNIVIPENMDYTEVFNDIFKKYLDKNELERVKLIDMGSMFELKYFITLKDNKKEKEFIDEIRVRNGNLKVSVSHNLEGSDL